MSLSKQIPIVETKTAGKMAPDSGLSTADKVRSIREALREEYNVPHSCPWVVAYSGGKDSTLVLHLVFELLLELRGAGYKRPVHVVANDTRVESPLIDSHLKKSMELISEFAGKNNLPVRTVITRPSINQTFWVNLIGKGYMPPTRNFRWCTEKLKIQPTTQYMRDLAVQNDGLVMLIGSRRQESTNRKKTLDKYMSDGERVNRHGTLENCWVFPAISELTTDEVWMCLLQMKCPWNANYRDMITIYRNALGGECPTVLSLDDAPSCGSSSPRFGCWTCTVVNKDRSLEGLINSGFEIFEPLAEFRNWLQELREDASMRMDIRRDGRKKVRADGSTVMGPFKLSVRKRIWNKLKALEAETNRRLITDEEEEIINYIWQQDSVKYELRAQHASMFANIGQPASDG